MCSVSLILSGLTIKNKIEPILLTYTLLKVYSQEMLFFGERAVNLRQLEQSALMYLEPNQGKSFIPRPVIVAGRWKDGGLLILMKR